MDLQRSLFENELGAIRLDMTGQVDYFIYYLEGNCSILNTALVNCRKSSRHPWTRLNFNVFLVYKPSSYVH